VVPNFIDLEEYKAMVFGVGRVTLKVLCSGVPVYVEDKDGGDGLLDRSSLNDFKACNFSGIYAVRAYHEMDFQKGANRIDRHISYKKALKRLKTDYKHLRECDSDSVVRQIKGLLYSVSKRTT
jgi:hypothetical protein